MRISDWISDVCSSDRRHRVRRLGDRARFCDLAVLLARGPAARAGGDRALWVNAASREMPDASPPVRSARPDPRRERRLDRQDRKRVVYGKSVSVRVDLGGRRFIKKKKI